MNLYYHIEWPESQKWLEQHDPVEDGLVISDNEMGCFVEKELYEYVTDNNGL